MTDVIFEIKDRPKINIKNIKTLTESKIYQNKIIETVIVYFNIDKILLLKKYANQKVRNRLVYNYIHIITHYFITGRTS